MCTTTVSWVIHKLYERAANRKPLEWHLSFARRLVGDSETKWERFYGLIQQFGPFNHHKKCYLASQTLDITPSSTIWWMVVQASWCRGASLQQHCCSMRVKINDCRKIDFLQENMEMEAYSPTTPTPEHRAKATQEWHKQPGVANPELKPQF